jgi:hypothetical protein
MKKKKIIIPLLVIIILLISFSLVSPNFLWNVFSGRVSFPENNVGSKLTMEDGKQYTILRTLHVDTKNNSASDFAVFMVRFKFKDLSLDTNKKLSMIPTPFLIGMEGFIEKNWVFNNNTGDFQGIYQWESKELAEKYPESFIFKLMTKRAVPGSLSYVIKPNTDLSQYLNKRICGIF